MNANNLCENRKDKSEDKSEDKSKDKRKDKRKDKGSPSCSMIYAPFLPSPRLEA